MTETFLGGNITAEFDGFFLQLTAANLDGTEIVILSVQQWEDLARYMAGELARKRREAGTDGNQGV